MEKATEQGIEISETKEVVIQVIPKESIDSQVVKIENMLNDWKGHCDKQKSSLEARLIKLNSWKTQLEEK